MAITTIGGILAGAGKYLVDYFKDKTKQVADKALGGGGGKETVHPKTLIEKNPAEMYSRGGREGRESKNPYSPRPAYGGAYAALIPLILGAAWMAYLVVGSKAKPAEVQLSPAANNLVVSLFIFIIVYSVFLALFFWNRTRALKAKETKKIIKRPKKKR